MDIFLLKLCFNSMCYHKKMSLIFLNENVNLKTFKLSFYLFIFGFLIDILSGYEIYEDYSIYD